MSDNERDIVGVPLHESDEPRLWAEVRELAAAGGVDAPDAIWLVPDAEVRGHRELCLGAPLLVGLTQQEVRSLIAHELAHSFGSRAVTALYRGTSSMPGDPGALARIRHAVAGPALRRRERRADEFAVRTVGRDAAASALARLAPLDLAWRHFMSSYGALGQDTGRRPADIFGGFGLLLAEPDVQAQLAQMAAELPEPVRTAFDNHAPMAQRLALIRGLAPDGMVDSGRPGTDLLVDPSRAFDQLETVMCEGGGLVATAWETLVADDAAAQVLSGAQALGKLARTAGQPATLRGVVDLLAVPGSTGLIDPDDVDEDREAVGNLLGDSAAHLLARSGAASFALVWGQSPVLTSVTGAELDPWTPAQVLAESGSTSDITRWVELHGVDLDAHLP